MDRLISLIGGDGVRIRCLACAYLRADWEGRDLGCRVSRTKGAPPRGALRCQRQDNWQSLECWARANDGERFSTEWGDGPRYLGLRLLDWVELADTAPRWIEICGLQGAIDRWRCNHPNLEQRRKCIEQHEASSAEPIGEPPF
jgi:hypothetical protein